MEMKNVYRRLDVGVEVGDGNISGKLVVQALEMVVLGCVPYPNLRCQKAGSNNFVSDRKKTSNVQTFFQK
jgi:hypothetical protein